MDDKSKQQGQGSQQNPKDARPGMADRGDDRNREEAGKPIQLDEKGQEKKPGMAQPGGGQHDKPSEKQGGQYGGGHQQGQGGSQQGGQKK